MHRLLIWASLVILVVGLAGCGSGSGTAVPTSTSGSHAAVGISIHNYKFGPASVTVARGTRVTWTDKDPYDHTVTGYPTNVAPFGSSTLSKGSTYAFTFAKPSVYRYHCSFHTFMMGSITVR